MMDKDKGYYAIYNDFHKIKKALFFGKFSSIKGKPHGFVVRWTGAITVPYIETDTPLADAVTLHRYMSSGFRGKKSSKSPTR